MKEKLHIGLCRIRELKECTYIPHIAKLVEETKTIASYLAECISDSKYNEYIKLAIEEYSETQDEEIEPYQIHFITNPLEFDPAVTMRKMFEQVVFDYPVFWDSVLSSLKRQSAIVNRRKYLIENTQLMADECKKHEYLDLAEFLIEYQSKQKEIIATI